MEQQNKASRAEINERFKNLLNEKDFSSILNEIEGIKSSYDQAYRLVYKTQKEAFEQEQAIKQENHKEEGFEAEKFKFVPDEHSHRFKELMTIFTEKKKEYKKALAQEQEDNFNKKTDIVAQLKTLTEQELTNFGETFKRFKTLQEEWKSIGDVNKARFQTLQTEYSHLVDTFFYNVNIHKELQNYSFEKNKNQKQAIIYNLEELTKNDSIIQLEHYIKRYQKEWDEIGPTFQEEWEKLKTDYWENVNLVYDKIREHYLKIREAQKASIEKKQIIIQKAKELVDLLKTAQNPSKWNEYSNSLKELQQEWRKTGFSKKTKDEELWNEFREISNLFFDEMKQLFDALNEKRARFEDKKKELIAKAIELKSSKNWRETTQKFIKLQDEWKKSGALNPKKDQKLWIAFRGACNEFFDRKKEFFGGLDARQEENLKLKKDIIKKIPQLNSLEEFNQEMTSWWAIGHVPKKEMNKINNSLDKALSTLAQNLKIEKDLLEGKSFEIKIKAYQNNDEAASLLEKEKRFVKEKIEHLKQEMLQLENNLSFFGDTKGAQKLKEVVLKRVESSRIKIESWKEKLKFIG